MSCFVDVVATKSDYCNTLWCGLSENKKSGMDLLAHMVRKEPLRELTRMLQQVKIVKQEYVGTWIYSDV